MAATSNADAALAHGIGTDSHFWICHLEDCPLRRVYLYLESPTTVNLEINQGPSEANPQPNHEEKEINADNNTVTEFSDEEENEGGIFGFFHKLYSGARSVLLNTNICNVSDTSTGDERSNSGSLGSEEESPKNVTHVGESVAPDAHFLDEGQKNAASNLKTESTDMVLQQRGGKTNPCNHKKKDPPVNGGEHFTADSYGATAAVGATGICRDAPARVNTGTHASGLVATTTTVAAVAGNEVETAHPTIQNGTEGVEKLNSECVEPTVTPAVTGAPHTHTLVQPPPPAAPAPNGGTVAVAVRPEAESPVVAVVAVPPPAQVAVLPPTVQQPPPPAPPAGVSALGNNELMMMLFKSQQSQLKSQQSHLSTLQSLLDKKDQSPGPGTGTGTTVQPQQHNDKIVWPMEKAQAKSLPLRTWGEQFAALASFHAKNGHFNVPFSDDRRLHNWVKNLRNSTSLTEDMKTKLHAIEFFPKEPVVDHLVASLQQRNSVNNNNNNITARELQDPPEEQKRHFVCIVGSDYEVEGGNREGRNRQGGAPKNHSTWTSDEMESDDDEEKVHVPISPRGGTRQCKRKRKVSSASARPKKKGAGSSRRRYR
ncbi:expressed unknown protein [Seminavis robusta]|uniref:Helicase-associated domain-containing protein n=1 Tax=Seminavis robusta TaxID=568900 RepID=A0A9N8EV52_9STRA|nr:expressed unknown protein [Seminavis robusta]|eukprot:Sro1970_g308550.1 n/a (597) ;mRNA; r:17107-18950